MCLATRFVNDRSYRYGKINSYIRSHMDTLEKIWTHLLDPQYYNIIRIRNMDLRFQSPEYGWQKNEKKKENKKKRKRTDNYKALCASGKRN